MNRMLIARRAQVTRAAYDEALARGFFVNLEIISHRDDEAVSMVNVMSRR